MTCERCNGEGQVPKGPHFEPDGDDLFDVCGACGGDGGDFGEVDPRLQSFQRDLDSMQRNPHFEAECLRRFLSTLADQAEQHGHSELATIYRASLTPVDAGDEAFGPAYDKPCPVCEDIGDKTCPFCGGAL